MSARRRARRDQGQALVEMAFVLPILLTMMFGIIEFGRFMFAYATLNNAIREASRYAIVHGSTSLCPSGPLPNGQTGAYNPCYDLAGTNVVTRLRAEAFTFGQSPDLVVAPPIWRDNNNARGSTVTVSAAYTWRTIIPLLPSITMQASSTDVINY